MVVLLIVGIIGMGLKATGQISPKKQKIMGHIAIFSCQIKPRFYNHRPPTNKGSQINIS